MNKKYYRNDYNYLYEDEEIIHFYLKKTKVLNEDKNRINKCLDQTKKQTSNIII